MAGQTKATNRKDATRDYVLDRLYRYATALQGLLVMGIFGFFNTEYGFFSQHFVLWGKYIIFPGFIATELVTAGIFTYQYLQKEKHNRTIKDHLLLGATWFKAVFIFFSCMAGLGYFSDPKMLSPSLMIVGLGMFGAISFITCLHSIYQRYQSSVNHGKDNPRFSHWKAFVRAFNEHRTELLMSVLLLAVSSCVCVANYIPALMVGIPDVSPLTVLVGVLLGLSTITLAFAKNPPRIAHTTEIFTIQKTMGRDPLERDTANEKELLETCRNLHKDVPADVSQARNQLFGLASAPAKALRLSVSTAALADPNASASSRKPATMNADEQRASLLGATQ